MNTNFKAAGEVPVKLLHTNPICNNKIIPLHVSLYITNKCNLKCKFCSRFNKDGAEELNFEEIKNIIDICKKHGTKAFTLSGGGEPLMHNDINEVIRYGNCAMSMVTNGTLLKRLEKHTNLIWCRISNGDDREPCYDVYDYAIKTNPNVDWSFSYVVMDEPKYDRIKKLIEYANKNHFTHVRLVGDLTSIDSVPSMYTVKNKLLKMGVDDSRVLYREDNEIITKGAKDCYVSLLRPLITPDGVFPCCGGQYAVDGNNMEKRNKMKLCNIEDLDKTLEKQLHFDGSRCIRCYYNQYNIMLSYMKNEPKHKEFV